MSKNNQENFKSSFGFDIIIENPKGSYKSFESATADYPLKGVTYPVDYGYIKGHEGEDGADLDVFVGSGSLLGFIRVWRLDVPEETKMLINITQHELGLILETFKPVVLSHEVLEEVDFLDKLSHFKK